MSLETVAADIRDEARRRAEEIRTDAEERAEEIVSAAETDAEEIVADHERVVDRRIEQAREQTRSSATLEAKQTRLEARRDLLESVRESVEQRIAELSGDHREELTRLLLEDAAAEFADAEHVRVLGRADDEPLLSDLVDDYDGYEYAGTYDCLGGVVVESDESRVRVNNTFDSILEDVWEDNLKELSARLFETDQ